MPKIDLKVYFNFRSPYCYLASKRMFDVIDADDIQLLWRPLGGWDGRSPPERVAYKIAIVRQDVSRWCRRMGIPFIPPPPHTDPTKAALGSLLAERLGCLRRYIEEVMAEEWSHGQDIGDIEVLLRASRRAGLPDEAMLAALEDPAYQARLAENEAEAKADGVFGVPSFVVGHDIFWGNDRLDFLAEHLDSLRERPTP